MPRCRDRGASRHEPEEHRGGSEDRADLVSNTHSFTFTPEATAAAIVGILVLGCATSPWLQAAYFTGSIARTIVPSRSMHAVAEGPQEPVRFA